MFDKFIDVGSDNAIIDFEIEFLQQSSYEDHPSFTKKVYTAVRLSINSEFILILEKMVYYADPL